MSVLRNEKQLIRFEYDFAVDGGDVGAIALRADITPLKAGMIVTDIIVHAEAALAGDATPTVTFGDGTDVDAFLANSYGALDALNDVTRNSDLALLMDEDSVLTMSIGAEALTAGKLEIYVEVISK
jgi:hypothetical protein